MSAGMTFVFAGDSITDAGRRTDADGLGDGYVRLLEPEVRAEGGRVVNAGISGNRVRDLLTRWETDVMAESPDVLTIYVGVNDTWRRFDEGDETTPEAFEADYRVLLDRAKSAGVRDIVLVEPYLLPVRDEQELWLEDLSAKQSVVRALAAEYAAALVPLHGILTELAAGDNARIAPDGVHPKPEGNRAIAQAWRNARG